MLKKIIIGVVVLLVLLVVGLQLFLQYGLTDSLRKYILPAAKEKLKVDVSVENVSVNLLAGSFSVNGVKVANPAGFAEPEMAVVRRFGVKIGIPALLKGGIAEIKRAVVKDGVITIVRGKDGRLNIDPLLGTKREAEPATGAPAEQPPPPAEAKKPTETIIKSLEVKTILHYIDYMLTEDPFKLGLELQIKMTDVANFGNEDVLSGSVNLQGILLADGKKCAFDLKGQMAPIVDPKRLSFDVSGSMQEVDLKAFQPLARKEGIESGSVIGTATLLCKKGVFDPAKSELRLTVKNIKLTEEKRAEITSGLGLKDLRLPESLKLEIPVKGTLEHPEIDWKGAMNKALANPDVIKSVLQNLMQGKGK